MLSFCQLITRVIIAERMKPLFNLYNIIRHPCFGRHLVHLIWDASAFKEIVGSSIENHEYICQYERGFCADGDLYHRPKRMYHAENMVDLSTEAPIQSMLPPKRYGTTQNGDHQGHRQIQPLTERFHRTLRNRTLTGKARVAQALREAPPPQCSDRAVS